ncbi:MAG TPA: sigma-70 family RNA polymerase sigma factor [Acidimicrobiales bacterium]|nr:sigma-70 family RNA polymerase sigma factor [Acidimicrobiales bacterium]
MPQTRDQRDQDLVRLYLDEIGRYPLLTKADEARLGQLVQAGQAAQAELDSGAKLTPARRRELRRAVGAGEDATDEFVKANLRLVVSIASKYQWSGLPLLDLVQDGNLGLIHAVEKFDWRKGFKFSTYATWWIRQAIGRAIDNTARTIRLPGHVGDQIRKLKRTQTALEARLGRAPTEAELAAETGIAEELVVDLLRYDDEPISLAVTVGETEDTELGELIADRSTPSPFDEAADRMLPEELERLLSPLADNERRVLWLRYGLDRGEPRTLDEVGEVLELSGERIRKIERNALRKLRADLVGTDAHELLAS